MKKLVSILMAIMMVAMVGAAWAANNGDVYQDDSLTAVSGTLIPMTKSIIMFNLNGSPVYEPNISYTYSVAPVTESSLIGKITDDGELNSNVPVTVQVNATGQREVSIYIRTDVGKIGISLKNREVNSSIVHGKPGTNIFIDLKKFRKRFGIIRFLIRVQLNIRLKFDHIRLNV